MSVEPALCSVLNMHSHKLSFYYTFYIATWVACHIICIWMHRGKHYPFDASCHVYKKSSWRAVASFEPLYRIEIFWNYQVYLYANNNIKDFTYFMEFRSKLHSGMLLTCLIWIVLLYFHIICQILIHFIIDKKNGHWKIAKLFLLRCT